MKYLGAFHCIIQPSAAIFISRQNSSAINRAILFQHFCSRCKRCTSVCLSVCLSVFNPAVNQNPAVL